MRTLRINGIISVFSAIFLITACMPDLVVDGLKIYPAYPTTIEQFHGIVRVKNRRVWTASRSHVEIEIRNKRILLPPSYIVYSQQFNVPSLEWYGTHKLKFFKKLENPGKYTVTATADIADQVSEADEENNSETIEFSVLEIPRFIDTDYIELEKIEKISKFRSAVGHDASDAFESCRSMKHYFQPYVNTPFVNIRSPIKGTITGTYNQPEGGLKIRITSDAHPSFSVSIYHLIITYSLPADNLVEAGRPLGIHYPQETNVDIEVSFEKPDGVKMISYFDVMTDSLFQNYQDRGLSSRQDAIISREARDADPLFCTADAFANSGSLENWVTF